MVRFVMPNFYVEPWGLPLNWRAEVSGVLPAAMWAYISHVADPKEPAPSEEQLEAIVVYIRYFIQAPCWRGGEELAALRAEAAQLASTVEAIRRWNWQAMKIGLDPF